MKTKTENLNMKLTPDELKEIKELAKKYTHGNVTKFIVRSVLSRPNKNWWRKNEKVNS